MGFSLGSLNPFANTGINDKIRNTAESVAVVAGDYFLPGSSIFTKNLAAKGSQKQLASGIGVAAQVITSGVGLGIGSSYTGINPSTAGKAMQVGIDKGIAKIGGGVATGAAALFGSVKAPTVPVGGQPSTLAGTTGYTDAMGYPAGDGSTTQPAPSPASPTGQNSGLVPLLIAGALAIAAKVL